MQRGYLVEFEDIMGVIVLVVGSLIVDRWVYGTV